MEFSLVLYNILKLASLVISIMYGCVVIINGLKKYGNVSWYSLLAFGIGTAVFIFLQFDMFKFSW